MKIFNFFKNLLSAINYVVVEGKKLEKKVEEKTNKIIELEKTIVTLQNENVKLTLRLNKQELKPLKDGDMFDNGRLR